MKRFLIAAAALLVAVPALVPASAAPPKTAQKLVPKDIAPIYRHSFTARYDLIGESAVREAAISPDGRFAGFVSDNNLFIKELSSGKVGRITTDGERNKIINGAADWVYEEEYGFTRAWEFSPDSRQIAFLRFDESKVREFTMMRFAGRLYPEPYTFKYPKAGEHNSVVTLWMYDIYEGTLRQVDTGAETDQYIPRIGWTPAGRGTGGKLFFYRVNRLQNLFEVVLCDGKPDGKTGGRVIYSESSPKYVERPSNETVTFLPDGDRFIVRQETRTGWMHLYLHSIGRGFLNAITSGEWEVMDVKGIKGDIVTYTSNEFTPISRATWSVRLNGKGKKRVGDEAMWINDNGINRIGPKDERVFFEFTHSGSVTLNGWCLYPEGFDFEGEKKYPVFMTQYSGPGSQSVTVTPLSAGDRAIYEPLVEAGYIVVCVDGRGTGGRGEAFKKCTYGQLGKLEAQDQIAAARWLASRPWVDAGRIGIYGWSFGGFTALNCILKGANVFAAAVAVAPVTSWRYYDTIYTEIYNGLPDENPGGYDDNSPLNFAADLRGKLLLVHGTGDDNVHIQNSYEMARALVAADKKFDMMTYTDDNHSMLPAGSKHVREKIVDWVTTNL